MQSAVNDITSLLTGRLRALLAQPVGLGVLPLEEEVPGVDNLAAQLGVQLLPESTEVRKRILDIILKESIRISFRITSF